MPLVYIVEDDEDIRELSVYALRGSGFGCEGYENAADFLEAAEHKRSDLALLDIMLPGEDGLSLSIVKHVAEYHASRVEAESAEGEGSLFTCRLPIKP